MADEVIIELIGQGAFENLDKALDKIKELGDNIVEINTKVKNVGSSSGSSGGGGGSGSKETLNEFKKIEEQIRKMKEQSEALNKGLGEQWAKATIELRNTKQAYKEANDEAKKFADAQKKAANDKKKADADAKKRAKDLEKASKDRMKAIKMAEQWEKQEARLAKEKERLQKQLDKEAAATEKANSAYEKLKKEYNEAATTARNLSTELFNLKRGGTASSDEIIKMGKSADEANKKAMDLARGLAQIEMASGNGTRAQGQFNALMFETNQLLREAPNFALSFRTGMMALSNNLPMFADQFRKVSKEIDNTTGKAKGFGGALKQVGSAIFSWQTLLIVGITLMLQYSKEIGNFFSSLFGGNEMLNKYNDALKESLESLSDELKVVVEVNAVLSNNLSTREDITNALNKYSEQFPAIIEGLDNESAKTILLNGLLEQQIASLLKIAQLNAQKKVVEDATLEYMKQLEKLGKEPSFWDRFRPNQQNRDLLMFVEGGHKVVETVNTMIERQKKLREAWDNVVLATRTADDTNKKTVQTLQVLLEVGEKELAQYSKSSNAIESEINARKESIRFIKLQIESLQGLEAQMIKMNSRYEDDSNLLRTRANLVKDENETLYKNLMTQSIYTKMAGKMSELYAEKEVQAHEARMKSIKQGALVETEADRINERNKQKRIELIRLEAELEIQSLNQKKSSAKQRVKIEKDYEKERMLAENKVKELEKEGREAAIKEKQNSLKTIISAQENELNKRLNANANYYENELKLIENYEGTKIAQLEATLQYIEYIEKKAASKRTVQENIDLINKKVYETELSNLQFTYNQKRNKALIDYYDNENNIIKTNLKYQVELIDRSTKDIENNVKNERNKSLVELNTSFKKGEITLREYNKRYKQIITDFEEGTFQTMSDFLIKGIEDVKNKLADPTITNELKAVLEGQLTYLTDALANLKPSRERTKDKTIWDFLGFGKKDIEQQRQEVARNIEESFNSVLDMMSALRQKQFDEEAKRLEREKKDITDRYELERNEILATSKTQEEKERLLKQLEADKIAREKINDLRQRQNDRARAIREKNDAIFRAEIEGIVAITKAISSAANPILAAVNVALISGMLASNIMTLRSKSIPEYGEGTDFHKGGLAIVGDKGTEIVHTPSDNKSYLTPNKPTLINLERGAKVIPNHELLSNNNANFMRYATNLGTVTPDSYMKGLLESFENQFSYLGDKFMQGINNIPKDTISLSEGELIKFREINGNKIKYINKIKGIS